MIDIKTPAGGVVSSENSTTSALTADASFQGTGVDVTGFSHATVTFVGTAASTAPGTLYLEKSLDNTNWESIPRVVTGITAERPFTFLLTAQYFRVKYTNGSVAQTTFRLQTKLHRVFPGPVSVVDVNTVTKGTEAQFVQNISDHRLDLARSKFTYQAPIHKFGARVSVSAGASSAFVPVTTNEVYQTPQVAGAVALRVAAGNAADASGGAGAREITLEGLDETGAYVTEAIATNGASAGTASTTTFLRLFRAYVSASGTYATTGGGSHAADIVIETAASAEWARIESSNGFEDSQTQIAWYSVPLGKEVYLKDYTLTVDGNKSCDFIFVQRRSILDTAAPYQAMRVVLTHYGVTGLVSPVIDVPIGPFPALTDIGWLVRGATTPNVTANFELIEIDTT